MRLTPSPAAVLSGHIDERALAKELGRTVKTIRRWRSEGLPIAIARGSLRYYDIGVVRAWLRGEPQPGRRRRA